MDLYQELFNHFHGEHGLTLLQSEMQEVVSIVEKHQPLEFKQGNKIEHHAKEIIKKLTTRPRLEDDDGFYDLVNDEIQMINIVKEYLSNNCVKIC